MEPGDSQTATDAYRLEPATEEGLAAAVAAGDDPAAVILAGLRGVLALAVGREGSGEGDEATLAAPIAAAGDDLAATFAGLAEALLGQVELFGAGLERVRLDGLLATDSGGFSAWGYALGRDAAGPLPRPLAVAAADVTTGDDGRLVLRCALRRL